MTRARWMVFGAAGLTVIVGAVVVLLVIVPLLGPVQTNIRAVMARDLDAQYQPIEPTGTFGPEDAFYLSVQIERPVVNSIVSARWYYGSRLIMTQDQVISAEEGPHYVGFELRRVDEIWPTGAYHVEILLNGSPVGSASFQVTAATPS